ncbi:unnamed protein product [Caenorhabditis bovis]|uniref:BED-type domain-containing protein n=1 Tax=Caenorhabditis bovis TaxID=2654633 RepID=A0A8S1EUT8_9PELO|nr:unnamed protein product [Caenorhabditis bovis]
MPKTEFGTALAVNSSTASDDHVDVSSFTTTTSDSSPPYSVEHHSPNDQRTETPTSDSGNQSFSPENVATSFDSSERDASPDNLSTSSTNINDLAEKPIGINMDEELQRQLLRFQQEFKDTLMEKNQNTLNMMTAFNQQLFKTTFANAISNIGAAGAQLPVNLGTAFSLPTTPTPTTPTPVEVPPPAPVKRKRQRRNPVWPYFDVVDGTARCKQCLYSTKSVFSTNLKVHLRSHHRADYEKVILAEDALNLNALLLSGNTSKLFNLDANRKRMPPMTSSILMTINKLTNQQQNGEDNPLNNVLRLTLAQNGLQQHLQQVQSQLQAVQAQKQQQQQQQQPQFALNAANLAALNQLARNQMQQQQQSATTTTTTPQVSQDHIINHLNFPAHIKQEILNAPHGTDANGVPQPKRRRLRRHPVWMFFRDLEDRMVGCINCEFRTGSAFSTNLKMHLKAHHKDDYERVLQLEEEMRLEEGCLGPANKIKSELIDFIRGGGNASSTPAAGAAFGGPKASPLVQQIINQSMARASSPTSQKRADDEPPFNGMSTSDKLAALVGIADPDKKATTTTTLDELRQAAERLFAAGNMGGLMGAGQQQQQQPQQPAAATTPPTTIVDLNGSIIASETKSTCSSSDVIDDRKAERDKALARLWAQDSSLISNDQFRDFVHTLAPDYEIPDAECLATQLE